MAITVTFPKDGEGFEAEVRIEGFHIVLKAIHTAVGPVARVYDARAGRWSDAEWAGDLNDAKVRAEAIARGLYTNTHPPKGHFPETLNWQKTGG